MQRIRFHLFTKVILWFFLNLGIIVVSLFLLFNGRPGPNAPFFLRIPSPIDGLTRQIESETYDRSPAQRDEVLAKYSSEYGVNFYLFDITGKQLAGPPVELPEAVRQSVTHDDLANVPLPERPPGPTMPPSVSPGPGRPHGPPSSYFTSENPKLHWFVGRILTIDEGTGDALRTRLVVSSDSLTGHGLFFDVRPFITVAVVVVILSIILWLPFVRGITRDIGEMSAATGMIAEEKFNVHVSEKRTDELGSLGRSINYLAERLSNFVHGQKRFLGDVSHELNSPLARMQFALSILEDRIGPENKELVADISEEIGLMKRLVNELLDYSKAGIQARSVELANVPLKPLVELVVKRETAEKNADIKVDVDDSLDVLAPPELLSRAVANVVRNGIRYGGDLKISADNGGGRVQLLISDNGPGVPAAELDRIFEPLYRVETHRSRQDGGSGLGLAIARSCVEACGGKIYAENLKPSGLEVTIVLNRAA